MIIKDFQNHQPRNKYFVGLDSDGTVFNSMELKHKDCFVGSLIRVFNLVAITREVHDVWSHVNIFSKNRGTNRFKALLLTFNYLKEMSQVKKLDIYLPSLNSLKKWINSTKNLSNNSLKKIVSKVSQKEKIELKTVLEWSEEVDHMVKTTVIKLPPLKGALYAMKNIIDFADIVVISNTPLDTLNREWSENKIINYVLYIGGQELGTKTAMLKAVADKKYHPNKILIIGDAPGDLRAAQNINGLFFPILPLAEEESWNEFNEVGYKNFINNSYIGKYQAHQIKIFQSKLDIAPPWEN